MTSAAPEAPAQLEELLGDFDRTQAMLKDEPEKFRELITNYARRVNNADQSLRQQVEEQVQATMADFFRDQDPKDRPDVRPDNAVGLGKDRGQRYNKNAPGAKLDGVFDGTGDLLQALWQERTGTRAGVERMTCAPAP